MPTYPTRFVGRVRERLALASAVDQARLVTVCGIGGAGKTRLALETATSLLDAHRGDPRPLEICWVPLVAVTDPAEVWTAMAAGLGLTGTFSAGQAGAIISTLRNGPTLVVLDNCEQVVAACAELVGSLIMDCPELRFLATSRVPIGLSAEMIYTIPPLGAGVVNAAEPFATDATALFVDRAAAIAPAYALTELNGQSLLDICRLLDGLPLAIELAASWTRVLSPRDLLAELTAARLKLDTQSELVEDRHRSMQAVLASSWSWLSGHERSILSAMAVFAGGCTFEAAQAVARADSASLARLAELSLIQRQPDVHGGSRYELHEMVRSYAVGQLEQPDAVHDRHLQYFLAVVDSLNPSWDTPIEPLWTAPANADVANIDAAGGWALQRGDAELAQRLAVGLGQFYMSGAVSFEHRLGRLQASLALPGPLSTVAQIRARARALCQVGLRYFSIDPSSSHRYFADAGRLFEQAGDRAGAAECRRGHGNALLLEGDFDGSRRICLTSLAEDRACGNRNGVGWSLETLGAAALDSGDWADAVSYLDEAKRIFVELGNPAGACCCEIEMAIAHQLAGQWLAAVDACSRALICQQQNRLTADWPEIIEVTARLCTELDHWKTAAYLYGAVDRWHSHQETTSWWPLVSRFSRVENARRQMGEPAWKDAFAAGQAFGADQTTHVANDTLNKLRTDLGHDPSGLTVREREVLQLVADGLTDAQIATQLVLSPRTIHAHLRSIYLKLDVTTRTAAVAAGRTALRKGKFRSPTPD